jgi:hypothetical protein
MDLEQDIRDHVLSALPYDPTKRAELAVKSAAELLIIYLNWFNRLVPAQPRRVHLSQAMQRNSAYAALKSDIDQIIGKIGAGSNLTAHLSTRVKNGYESPTKGKYNRRPDLDLMLAEWQVHHLHISNVIEANGFVKRDGPLIFAAFRPEDAYLIDIFDHGDWTREAIAQILIDEWPQCGFVRELKNIIGLSRHTTEEERKALRNAGISSPFMEYKGKFYAVGLGGITSAGTAVAATRHANYIMAASRSFAKHVVENPTYISDTLIANSVQPPASPDLHLVFMPDGTCRILERNTKALFPLPPAR